MSRYTVTITIEGSRIDAVKKAAAEAFGPLAEASVVAVEKIDRRQKSRADRLSEAEGLINEGKEIVEELANEMREWYDNLPENFQNTDKGEAVGTAADSLEEMNDALDLDFAIDFPSMF